MFRAPLGRFQERSLKSTFCLSRLLRTLMFSVQNCRVSFKRSMRFQSCTALVVEQSKLEMLGYSFILTDKFCMFKCFLALTSQRNTLNSIIFKDESFVCSFSGSRVLNLERSTSTEMYGSCSLGNPWKLIAALRTNSNLTLNLQQTPSFPRDASEQRQAEHPLSRRSFSQRR